MKSERKFYKTRFVFEVLSEEPCDDWDLDDIVQECIDGAFSLGGMERQSQQIDGKAAAKALMDQGSDPGFFGMTDSGEDEEVEDAL